MKGILRAIVESVGPREAAAAAGAVLLWWGLHSIYRPAAPVAFGVMLLFAAFGPRVSR
jgi:hypothetical protein